MERAPYALDVLHSRYKYEFPVSSLEDNIHGTGPVLAKIVSDVMGHIFEDYDMWLELTIVEPRNLRYYMTPPLYLIYVQKITLVPHVNKLLEVALLPIRLYERHIGDMLEEDRYTLLRL